MDRNSSDPHLYYGKEAFYDNKVKKAPLKREINGQAYSFVCFRVVIDNTITTAYKSPPPENRQTPIHGRR